jgi:N-acetylglucosaminyldiphosphoundecaprenol N-acetyl-beta-D-mannosaminyltransferase
MKKNIFGINISTGLYEEFIARITELGHNKRPSYACLVNVHMIIEAYRGNKLAEVINNAEIATPDGMPLVCALKILHGIKQTRAAGMDLLPDLIEEAEIQGLSVYFFGSTLKVLNAVQDRINRDHPNLKVAGSYSPPFRSLTYEEEYQDVGRINNSYAEIVFVALGCPKQEMWMARNYKKINAVLVGVGAALPVYAGLQARAPLWMQRFSLEWLFRLFQEPRRLWKRYLITNLFFLYLLFKELTINKIKKLVKV